MSDFRTPSFDRAGNYDAWLGQLRSQDPWYVYGFGFRSAANALVEHLNEPITRRNLLGRRHLTDYFVYPVLFLYRQYLEIRLKELAGDLHRELGDSWSVPRRHQLTPLWLDCLECMGRRGYGGLTKEELSGIASVVAGFDNLDPHSTLFRYPPEEKSLDNLFANSEWMNLQSVKNAIDEVADLFDMLMW